MNGEISNLYVCLMGMGFVFFGLICLVIVCHMLSAIARMKEQRTSGSMAQSTESSGIETAAASQEDDGLIAAVTAVIAEETGKDFSSIQVLSFKRI